MHQRSPILPAQRGGRPLLAPSPLAPQRRLVTGRVTGRVTAPTVESCRLNMTRERPLAVTASLSSRRRAHILRHRYLRHRYLRHRYPRQRGGRPVLCQTRRPRQRVAPYFTAPVFASRALSVTRQRPSVTTSALGVGNRRVRATNPRYARQREERPIFCWIPVSFRPGLRLRFIHSVRLTHSVRFRSPVRLAHSLRLAHPVPRGRRLARSRFVLLGKRQCTAHQFRAHPIARSLAWP